MNPEALLIEVQNLLESQVFSTSGNYHLCHFTDRLQILPPNHTVKPHTVFMTLQPRHLTEGLSNPEWDLLLHKLSAFYGSKI